MIETVKDFYLDKNIKMSKEEHFNVLTNLVNNKPGEYTKLVDRLTIQNYRVFKDKPRTSSTENNIIRFIKTFKNTGR